jgi:hypothetical protein
MMREHTLETTCGQSYSPMGRFLDENGKPTSDEAQAAKDPKTGQPVANEPRNMWVTETALTTALNVAYFGERARRRSPSRSTRPPRPRTERRLRSEAKGGFGRPSCISITSKGRCTVTLVWFVVWFVFNLIGDEEPLTFDPVNFWAGSLLFVVALDLSKTHVLNRGK